MAYRKDYLHRDRRPPPPYSRHKHNGTEPNTNSSSFTSNDSKLPTELFQDMSKKIANLTKIICNLTNKLEDQEFFVKQTKLDHQKELQNLQSESENSITSYKSKVDALEAHLLEEKRQKAQREEEFQILRRICNFTENFRPFRNTLKASTEEKNLFNKEILSEDMKLCRTKLRSERRPRSACLSLESTSPTNGSNRISDTSGFVAHKFKDDENYQEEIKALVKMCEKLREEKRELQSKYELHLSKNKCKDNETALSDLESAISLQCSAINDLKAKLEKQELQYRKRIGEVLQHLTQSESRAEKYVKQIKQLDTKLSAKECQVSAMNEELSRTVELLKQTKEEYSRIQKLTNQQKQNLLNQADEIKKLEDQLSNYSSQLLEANRTIKELQNKLEQFKECSRRIASQSDVITFKVESDCASEKRNKAENANRKNQTSSDTITEPNTIAVGTADEEKASLCQYFKEREQVLMAEIEKTKETYEQYVEQERLVHNEIQDNLEQQLDLLHSNLRQIMINESEELNSLRCSLEKNSILLEKANEKLAHATSTATDLESKLRKRENECTKMAENLKQTQKLNLVEKLQGAMAKCLPGKESFIFPLETKYLNSKTLKNKEGKTDNVESETDHLGKMEILDRRIQALENAKLILLKEQDIIKHTHRIELEAQSEAHKKDISKLKHVMEASCQEEKQILRKEYQDKLISIKEGKEHFPRKHHCEKTDGHKKSIEVLQKKLLEMQQQVSKKEEDVKVKQIQTSELAELVGKLKQEKNCILLSQNQKVQAIRQETSQQIRNLENYWQERLAKEFKKISQAFEKEKQKLTTQYSRDQRLLKDKISLLQSTILNTSVEFDNQKPLHYVEFKKLQDTIISKDSQIRKLQEENDFLQSELALRRGRSSSLHSPLHSTQVLMNNVEMSVCLKKPRLERPPLTPQLVRRHSLMGNSEQKWFRARSQSPLDGNFREKFPVKPVLSEIHNHRASWTGDCVDDLLNCAIEVSNEVEKLTDSDHSITGVTIRDNCESDEATKFVKVIQNIIPETKSNCIVSDDDKTHDHLCDTIIECDEIHAVVEEKSSKIANGKLIHNNVSKEISC